MSAQDLNESIDLIDARMARTWPGDGPYALLERVFRELGELIRAMREVDADGTDAHVVEECGDAMLLLARIALVYGAEDGLEPLRVSTEKVLRRLDVLERLVADGWDVREAWEQAKSEVG